MAIIEIKDGQVVESASQSSLKATKSNGMDKDAFLQLLVAQMKFQDPLEPTSNTEYISQYAQFSQVEQMQNMAGSMTLQRASSLVGQEVFIVTTNSAGKTTEIQGKVDYVTYENNKAYLSVNGSLYSMDDLKQVTDKEYKDAYEKAYSFAVAVNKLPAVENMTLSDEKTVTGIQEQYDGMSKYEQSFIAKDLLERIKLYTNKLQELKLAAAAKEEEGSVEEA